MITVVLLDAYFVLDIALVFDVFVLVSVTEMDCKLTSASRRFQRFPLLTLYVNDVVVMLILVVPINMVMEPIIFTLLLAKCQPYLNVNQQLTSLPLG